ncbi:MAG: hypothetical protein KC503_37940 [Myxococcales bacterium]|nr:hypothetical protein [Myxococcales bacterium]
MLYKRISSLLLATSLALALAACGDSTPPAGDLPPSGGDSTVDGSTPNPDLTSDGVAPDGPQDGTPGDTTSDGIAPDISADGPPLPDTAGATPTAFRVNTLSLADPHIYLGCAIDLSSTVDGLISDQITKDGDADNLLDLSLLIVFRPLSQGTAMGTVELAQGDCAPPHPPSSCSRTLATQPALGISTYNNQTTGMCLTRTHNGVNVSRHNAGETSAPCFVSTARSVTLQLAGISIPLRDLQIAGRYTGNPATGLDQGLLRGFLSKTAAAQVLLPATLPLVGGMPLSSILCDSGTNDDTDTHPTFGAGWWFFINYTASQVTYTEQ